MSKKKQQRLIIERKDEIIQTKNYGELTILEYKNANDSTIQFLNTGTVLYNKRYSDLPTLKDPMYPIIQGVGFFGLGEFKAKYPDNKPFPSYTSWKGMLERCYDDLQRNKYPTYKDAYVCEEWHNYQNFCSWYVPRYKKGFQLDKDIIKRGNKVYSPETCTLVPGEVNKLLTKTDSLRGDFPIGVVKKGNKYYSQCTVGNKKRIKKYFNTIEDAFNHYKQTKEDWIKVVANKWKGQIDQKVYETLVNYEVLITD